MDRSERDAIALADVPLAAEAEGFVEVFAERGSAFRLQHEGLVPVHAESIPAGQPAAGRARFRRDAAGGGGGPSEASLVVLRAGANPGATGTVVWDLEVTSIVHPGESARHVARLRVEHDGAPLLPVELPPGAVVERMAIDGQAFPLSVEDGSWAFPLPAQRRYVTLAIEYTRTHQARVPSAGSIHPHRDLTSPSP
jgi:hypothetical protein